MDRKIARTLEHTNDTTLDRMQKQTRDVATAVNAVPFLRGRLVPGLTFAAGVALTVNHNLGRKPQGYIITRNYGANVANTVGEATTQPDDPTRAINLITTLAATVDLWFF